RISDNEAAGLQSLSDSVTAVETAEVRIGDSVAIFGQGSMGLECMQIARVSGAGKIVAVVSNLNEQWQDDRRTRRAKPYVPCVTRFRHTCSTPPPITHRRRLIGLRDAS